MKVYIEAHIGIGKKTIGILLIALLSTVAFFAKTVLGQDYPTHLPSSGGGGSSGLDTNWLVFILIIVVVTLIAIVGILLFRSRRKKKQGLTILNANTKPFVQSYVKGPP